MKQSLGFGVSMAALCACSATLDDGSSVEDVAQSEAAIVRGTATTKRPEVVFVHGRTWSGGTTRCTGTYFAARVVVTSATCIRNDLRDVFVYHGANYPTDVASLPNIPAPGQTSVWAKADSWERHPAYNATLHDAEIGVVYLDRKLPFDPLPLARFRLDDSYNGKVVEIAGWGANVALSADITQYEGLGIKRNALVPIVGTPTAADYHADDPNPGMLDPVVRSHYIKLNGEAPLGNGCAGDGGGPIIVNRWGQDYIAGVGLWTGLWCEGYQIMTRIDPYLPFFDSAYMRGGQATVIPRLECVSQEPNGTLRAHFGYQNKNGVNVSVPYGSANYFPLDTKSARPSLFSNGDHAWSTSIAIPTGKQLYWKLSPTNSPTTELRVSASSVRCASGDWHVPCERYCRPQLAVPACPAETPRMTQDQCIGTCYAISADAVDFGCGTEYSAALACIAAVPTDPAKWQCFEGTPDPWPVAPLCDAEWNAFYGCLGI